MKRGTWPLWPSAGSWQLSRSEEKLWRIGRGSSYSRWCLGGYSRIITFLYYAVIYTVQCRWNLLWLWRPLHLFVSLVSLYIILVTDSLHCLVGFLIFVRLTRVCTEFYQLNLAELFISAECHLSVCVYGSNHGGTDRTHQPITNLGFPAVWETIDNKKVHC